MGMKNEEKNMMCLVESLVAIHLKVATIAALGYITIFGIERINE